MARWSRADEEYLAEHAGDGAEALAKALGRTVPSVKTHASRLGISLVVRYRCPKCGRDTYQPLTGWSGWCRACSIAESADTAAVKNRHIRLDVAEEERRIEQATRRRQAIYSDTEKQKRKLRRLRESCNSNATTEGEASD